MMAKAAQQQGWGVDPRKLQQLMMGKPVSIEEGEGAGGHLGEDIGELLSVNVQEPFTSGWEKCLDLKTGALYLVNRNSSSSNPSYKHSFHGISSPQPLSQDTAFGAPQQAKSHGRLEVKLERQNRSSHELHPRDQAATARRFHSSVLQGEVQQPARSNLRSTDRPGFLKSVDDSKAAQEHNIHRSYGQTTSLPEVEASWQRRDGKRDRGEGWMMGGDGWRAAKCGSWMGKEAGWSLSTTEGLSSGAAAMVAAACGRCLAYVLLEKLNPVCPRCGNTVAMELSLQPFSHQRSTQSKTKHEEQHQLHMGLATDEQQEDDKKQHVHILPLLDLNT